MKLGGNNSVCAGLFKFRLDFFVRHPGDNPDLRVQHPGGHRDVKIILIGRQGDDNSGGFVNARIHRVFIFRLVILKMSDKCPSMRRAVRVLMP